jgi:hypothetical protein
MSEVTHATAPAPNGRDLGKDESWIGIWIFQVRIFVTMLRESTPMAERGQSHQENSLLKLAKGQPCSAAEVIEVLTDGLDSAGRAAAEAGPLTGRVVSAWVRREGAPFRAAITSFANFYHLRCESEVPVDVESVFTDWIRTNQPAVLERATALVPALLFARLRDVDAPREVRKLLAELHQIRTSARRIAERLQAVVKNPLFDFQAVRTQLTTTAETIDAVLDGHEEVWQATGRPPNAFGPLLAILLRKAGLSNGDVGSTLGVTADAIRKQVRRTKSPNGRNSRPKKSSELRQNRDGAEESRKP